MRTLHSLLSGCLALILIVAAGIGPANAEAPISLIDGTKVGSLSIHKYAGDPLTQFGDPTNPNANLNRDPIAGIDFHIQRITDADLSTNEGWTAVAATNVRDYYPGGSRADSLGPVQTATTDATGVAKFEGLPIGAYLVTESQESAGRKNLTVTAPFIVTVPMTDPTNGAAWNYDVSVNAKDQQLAATKAADQACVKLGKDITFALSADLPAPNRDGAITRFEIVDPLADGLTHRAGSDIVYLGAEGKDNPRLAAEDYRVTTDGQVVRLELTDSGLAAAAAARNGAPDVRLSWSFVVDVAKSGIAAGTRLPNTGYVLPEGYPAYNTGDYIGADGTEPSRPGVPTNTVRVRIGDCGPGPLPLPIPIPIPVPDPGLIPGSSTPGAPAPGGSTTTPAPAPVQKDGEQPRKGGLAYTGAALLWPVLIGSTLILVGTFIMIGRRRSQREEN